MTDQDHLALARSQNFEALEATWRQSAANPGDVANYERTLEELCESNSVGVALDLAAQMIDALVSKDRLDDALRLATTLLRRGAHKDSLSQTLFELIQRLYSDADWFELVQRLSGLSADNLGVEAFREFDRLRRFTPGHVIYHRAGWGEGVVEQFDPQAREVTVRFASGSTKAFPLQSAIESLRPLDDDDLRSMRMLRLPELQQLAEKAPAALIVLVTRMNRGKATSTQVKDELCPVVVPTKKWAGYWKRAKAAAANDPWLQVEGSKTRPTFELRKKPLSLADEARRAMRHAGALSDALTVCRDYLARDLDAGARDVILMLAQERIESALRQGDEAHANLLDGILLLEEMGRSTSRSASDELRALLIDESGGFHPERFDDIVNRGSRDHAAGLLENALGEPWADLCVASITSFPTSVVERIVDRLAERGHAHRLAPVWKDVSPYPRRFPLLTYLLAKLSAEGHFADSPDAPDTVSVTRVALHLCRMLAKDRRGDIEASRLLTRLTSLLVGRRALLSASLNDLGRDDLTMFLGIAERGGSDFPREIMDAILRVVSRRFPDITSRDDRPFWENDDFVFVTAVGLERQKEDHRVLVDVKIPLNAKQIQHAASYGDLSENSEWEAAMEEQRKLTGRAEDMSQELRRARLIEDQDIPDGVVAPGTRVTITIHETRETTTYSILGPWDCTSTDQINYRAPMAQAFLGLSVGEQGSIELPTGTQTFSIEAIERIV